MRAEAVIAISMLMLGSVAAASAWRNTARRALRPTAGEALLPVRVIDPEFADCLFDRYLGAWRFQFGLAAMQVREGYREIEPQIGLGDPVRMVGAVGIEPTTSPV